MGDPAIVAAAFLGLVWVFVLFVVVTQGDTWSDEDEEDQ